MTASHTTPHLYLVDGSGFIFRAYHSLPPLTNPQGTPVGAVYGFVNMLTKLVDDMQADHIAVIFDAARQNFRHEIYADYKANRPEPPEDLVPQFALIKEATRALNLPAIEMEGYEADDLIAAYTKAARADGMEVTIVSSDKDLMQLVGDGVSMFDAMKNRHIHEAEVVEKFGVPPEKVIEVQALIGDSSDNVPGVPGIGPKTAAQLIEQYGTLENLLAHADDIPQKKRREMLIEYAEQARLSQQLVALDDSVALPEPIRGFDVKLPEADVLGAFLQQQGFRSLIAKWKAVLGEEVAAKAKSSEASDDDKAVLSLPEAPAPADCDYELIQDEEALRRWMTRIERAGRVAFDTETDGLDAMQCQLVGISLSIMAGEACYIPLGHGSGETQGDLLDDHTDDSLSVGEQLNRDRVIEMLKPMLEDSGMLKVGQNIKFDLLVMRRYGVDVAPIDDTMLMSYVLDSAANRHNMDELCQLHLGVTPVAFSDVVNRQNKRRSFADVPLEEARDYAAEDADLTLRLHDHFAPRLIDEHMGAFYETVERPLVPVLTAMEYRGIRVDPTVLNQMSHDFASRLEVLGQTIYRLAGREFTIGSPKQLGEIIYDELKLGEGKKGKSGSYATGADVLEELAAQGHELPTKVLEWRQLSKLKSTYTDALQAQVNPSTGRVHTSFSMAGTSTGRLSSNDPNLQNIPIRTEEGRAIRTAFVSEPGHVLIAADYSQIELRLLAHMADIDALKQAFREEKDIHSITAHQVFGVPLEDVSSELRRTAKMINFGLIYGMSAFGLSQRLGIPRKEAADYIEAYFTQYPGIRRYMDKVKAYAKEHGHVWTLCGRKCVIRGAGSKGPQAGFAERAAINAPLQGTAADIIKKAMIAVHRRLADAGLDGSMLLQVHDELLFEVPKDRADEVATMVKAAMESVVSLDVPLVVEVGVASNWGEAH